MIHTDPPREYAPLFRLERERLLDLLRSLDDADWRRPTPCPGWDVLGLVNHLLGGDLFLVSFLRDGHLGTVPPPDLDEPGFIAWLDRLQDDWVHAARRIGPPLAVELLAWSAEPAAAAIASQDPSAVAARVTWASDRPVPNWLDHARELTERWIHRQQLHDALDRPTDLRADLADPVLDALRWAYPHRLGTVERPAGSTVRIVVDDPVVGATWNLTAEQRGGWSFDDDASSTPIASIAMTADQAWRSLTNNLDAARHGAIDAVGDREVVAVLRATRAIIGDPR